MACCFVFFVFFLNPNEKTNNIINCYRTSLKVCNRLLPETDRVMSMWCMMKRGSSWLWYGKQARLSAINSSMFTSVFCRKKRGEKHNGGSVPDINLHCSVQI